MRKGTLCKVVINGHKPSQLGDKVLILQSRQSLAHPDTLLFTGINLRTNKKHHYYREDLEVINESR